MSNKIRLNKFVSSAGITSRRKADELISAGKVQVNGQVVVQLGTKINPSVDQVSVSGKSITLPESTTTYAINKPVGIVSTVKDEQGRKTVVDLVPSQPRVFPIGRLDIDSQGLLLLTNDGKLSQQLTHPKYHIAKTYEVLISKELNPNELAKVRKGLQLKNFKAKPVDIEFLRSADDGYWYQIILNEGKNRQIRRMMAALNCQVLRLIRTTIGQFNLNSLGDKRYIMLKESELSKLTS